jgi:hypothetical protein
MKSPFSKGHIQLIVSVSLATIPLPIVGAKPSCPGNVASLPLRLVNRYLLVVAVSINHSGPYNFLLDTGTTSSVVDRPLAAELHLITRGTEAIDGIGFHASVSSAGLDLIEAGSHAVANQAVLIYDLKSPKAGGPPVRGILGEDFLEHFDMLLDNAQRLLCLDDSGALRANMKGPHTPLVVPAPAVDGIALSNSLIVEARLSDQTEPVRLWLDSGANVSFLFNLSDYLTQKLTRDTSLEGIGGNAAQASFSALPAQDVKIATLRFQNVSFLTPAVAQKNLQATEFDGLLTTWLFRRVFVDHADHFAVLEPW